MSQSIPQCQCGTCFSCRWESLLTRVAERTKNKTGPHRIAIDMSTAVPAPADWEPGKNSVSAGEPDWEKLERFMDEVYPPSASVP